MSKSETNSKSKLPMFEADLVILISSFGFV